MGKIKLFILIGILIVFSSCENFDPNHPDYKYTSGYFPYQFPVRTIVLGDYIYDNTNDNAHKFLISVAMGGVYKNEKNRVFNIAVDNTLCNNILFKTNGDPITAMPSSYYSLNSNQITISKGELNGGVEVQLNDDFFNDPKAIKLGYVVPVRLIKSNDVDTILNGYSTNSNADPRISSQWNIAPKNFTMFAVKYINEIHGTYFKYGKSSVADIMNKLVEDSIYGEQYVEKNPIINLITTARHQVSLSTTMVSKVMTGQISMLLTFDGDNCIISAMPGSSYTITGSGKFYSKKYNWGNKSRDGLEIKYSVNNGTNIYSAEEVLVLRDRAVVMEVYSPVLMN
jgi:hypothetical protein